jgi:peptidoglycan/LPS O-acetylase OafA/YrhL
MRLAPLYYLTICVYTLLVFAPNLPEALERRADMMRKIPFLVTYMSEYVPLTKYPVFGQAWSLGIEEKFYLAWPAFAFVLLSSNKSRIVAAIGLSIVLGASSFLGVFEVFGKYYAELFVGCALALALNDRRSFERLAFLGTRVGQTIAFVVAILVQVLPVFAVVRSSALYGIVAGGIIASAAIGERSIWLTVLRSRVMVYIGQRSYALYLIHVLIVHVVVRARIFPAHTTPAALASFAVTLGLALVVAEGLYRLIEGPCIRRGHAWSSALQARRPVPEIAPG